jgi:UTP--glucose-1-phosphate uridylyltransferase
MKPTTAVIFAAGSGTRFLPVTSAVQKELLPILNRPVVDYVVSDLLAAGITRIIFIIRPGQTGLKDFYLGSAEYESTLQRLGKTADIEKLAALHARAAFEFVEQPADAGYGTAVPLRLALPLLDAAEPVIVCTGDDFIWHSDGTSETAAFIDTYLGSGAAGALMSLELPEESLGSYGVLATAADGGVDYLTDIVEKPAPGAAPSRLVNVSKYIMSGAQREYVNSVQPRPEVGETYLTDAIVMSLAEHKYAIHRVSGQYLDTGNVNNWLQANNTVAQSQTSL